MGLQNKNGVKVGLSLKDKKPLLDIGYKKKFKQEDLEYIIGLSVKSNLEDNVFNIKSDNFSWSHYLGCW